jgi:hypothetical protein
MMLIALLLIVLGFIHFALSTRAFYKLVFGRGRPTARLRNWLHCVGYLYLAIALVPCLQVWNTQMAIVVWLGLLHLGAVVVTMLLTYFPQFVKRLWQFACLGRLGKPFLPS